MDAPDQSIPADDWITNPDINLPRSHSFRSGIIRRLPAPDICVYDQPLPALPGEVRDFNDTYLEIASRVVKDKGWMAFLAGFGSAITITGLMGLTWALYQDEFRDYSWLVLILLPLLMAHTAMVYPPFTIAFFAPEYEPLRFCRHSRKVYRYRAWRCLWGGIDAYRLGKPAICMYDWSQCRAELVYIRNKQMRTTMDIILELVFLDPLTGDVIERVPVGEREHTRDVRKRVFLWETIRRYMENRAENIPPPVMLERRETLGDYIEAFNPFSMPARFDSRAGRLFGYIAGAMAWIFLLPLLPLMIFNWLVRKAERKIDWGKLGDTVFRLAPDDPVLQLMTQPELAAPGAPRGEPRRRNVAARLWLASLMLQIAVVGSIFVLRD